MHVTRFKLGVQVDVWSDGNFCDGFHWSLSLLSSTVMYEMLTGRWPYAGYAAETLIHMVGTGFRQSLDKIDCPKQLKVCVCVCGISIIRTGLAVSILYLVVLFFL